MEITKEQIKRIADVVKAMQEETLIDDVSGGYQPDPFKDSYAEIYTVIYECERGQSNIHDVKASIIDELAKIIEGCDKAINETALGSRSMTRYVGQREGVVACFNKVKEYLP
jgi:hypothetical protein